MVPTFIKIWNMLTYSFLIRDKTFDRWPSAPAPSEQPQLKHYLKVGAVGIAGFSGAPMSHSPSQSSRGRASLCFDSMSVVFKTWDTVGQPRKCSMLETRFPKL